jgi:hypothetical protein
VYTLLSRLYDQADLGVPDPGQFEWCVTAVVHQGAMDDGPKARQWYGELLAAIDHRPPAGTRSKKKRGKKPKK